MFECVFFHSAESRNSREPTPTTKVSRNEKEEIVPEKQEEEPEEVQEERSSKREVGILQQFIMYSTFPIRAYNLHVPACLKTRSVLMV